MTEGHRASPVSTAAPRQDRSIDLGLIKMRYRELGRPASIGLQVKPSTHRKQQKRRHQVAKMPLGQPRSVPDPAGDLYDQQMAKLRAQREAEDRGDGSPLDLAQNAFRDFQNGPRVPRPNTAETFIPVVGPAWEAIGDLQDGDYGGAAFNGAMAVADALPIGVGLKGLNSLRKGVGLMKGGSVTADAARKVLRRLGVAGPGEEVHHTVPLEGLGRNVQDWRNHYAFLKVLPQQQHRRLTGSWMGKPMYGPLRRAWYGTTDWMKAAPAGLAGWTADAVQNIAGPASPSGRGPGSTRTP
ncbi:MAG: hypothetical protein JWP86_3125 [Phenylobacterium sp.]|nr:hypothetical protein [Phenylobacterium sp.]